jgi:hypothetical protein
VFPHPDTPINLVVQPSLMPDGEAVRLFEFLKTNSGKQPCKIWYRSSPLA